MERFFFSLWYIQRKKKLTQNKIVSLEVQSPTTSSIAAR